MNYNNLFKLLQIALGQHQIELGKINAEEWQYLHNQAVRQSLLGILFVGISKCGQTPPKQVALQWAFESETIQGLSNKMDVAAKRLTELFYSKGHKSVILKGQANARLYPDTQCRQAGDIDIWIDGGKSKVLKLVKDLHLMRGATVSSFDVHIQQRHFGVPVEIHFKPCSGCRNPFANRQLQKFLDRELQNSELTEKGFFAPSRKFDLIMQLSHIERHFINGGIGLRQFVDYYLILKSSTDQDRRETAQLLRPLGLTQMAEATMWLLQNVFNLEDSLLLCKANETRGKWLLREVLNDGNFGQHSHRSKNSTAVWWFKNRLRLIQMIPFHPSEVLWTIFDFCFRFLFLVPARIRLMRNFSQKA